MNDTPRTDPDCFPLDELRDLPKLSMNTLAENGVTNDDADDWLVAWDLLAAWASRNSHRQGFHKKLHVHDPDPEIRVLSDSTRLMLIDSESAEALEAVRHGSPPSDKIPEFCGQEEELADIVIRVMDLAHSRGWRVASAVLEKMAFNASRPYLHGNKAI